MTPVTRPSGHDAPSTAGLERRARLGVWLLVVYGLLLALSTLTHQPDPTTDFAGYADYVTTTTFLVSHLVASILGAGLGILGAIALAVVAHAHSPRQAEAGLVAWVLGQTGMIAVFGTAAFAQPALGRTFLGGVEQVARDVESEVYGAPLFATVGVGLLLFIVGAVLLAGAAHRIPGVPRWATHTLWAATVVFVVSGFTLQLLQPIAGVVLAGASAVIALALRSTGTTSARKAGRRRAPAP